MLRSKHQWAAIAEREGLSLMQLHVIGLLRSGEALPMVRLSTLLTCDASYVTGIVDRLQEQGFVERRENPTDRRVKMIGLTKKGLTLGHKAERLMLEIQEKIFQRLTADEQHEFHRLLLKMTVDDSPGCQLFAKS
jgi:DNA-binding MarR family transcriptional regulator